VFFQKAHEGTDGNGLVRLDEKHVLGGTGKGQIGKDWWKDVDNLSGKTAAANPQAMPLLERREEVLHRVDADDAPFDQKGDAVAEASPPRCSV
jgi:hypothetical protein